MPILANICGFIAVGMFVFSYQLKKRNALILVNAGSRVLYVLQYILLRALSGAVLDIVALPVSLLAQNKSLTKMNYSHVKSLMINIILNFKKKFPNSSQFVTIFLFLKFNGILSLINPFEHKYQSSLTNS